MRKQLKKHRIRAHPPFQCQKWGKFLPRKANLEKHESIKHHACSVNDSFFTMNILRLHIENNHEAGNLKPDDEVESDKASSAEVPSHQSLVEGCKTCPVCSKMFFD